MFSRQSNQACQSTSGIRVRVKKAGASSAATGQGIGGAASTAAAGISKGVQQGVYSVRLWAAPRLESAADYTITTFAPKVSSALRGSANQIRPVEVTVKKSRGILTWSVFAAALLATGGAVAALVKYRYRGATMTKDEDFEDSAAGAVPVGAEGTVPAQNVPSTSGVAGAPGGPGSPGTASIPMDPTITGADTEVPGRVSTSGW